AVGAFAPARRVAGRAHCVGSAQSAHRRRDRASAALPDLARLPRAGDSAVPAQTARTVDAGAWLLAWRHDGTGAGESHQHGRHGVYLRGDAAEAAATSLVPLVL